MTVYRNILFATDFSAPAASALDVAAEFGRRFGARVHAVHIVSLNELDRPEAERQFPVAVPATFDDVVAGRRVRRGMAPELGILEAAREVHAELIVLGTHGCSGLKHVVLGSVAERVVQLAECAVLTVRPPAFKDSGRASGGPTPRSRE